MIVKMGHCSGPGLVMRGRNRVVALRGRGVVLTAVMGTLMGLLCAALPALPATAQDAVPGAGATIPEEIAAPLVDASHARRAQGLVEKWVLAAAVPPMDDPEAGEPMPVTGAIGVAVTLRVDGVEAGFGQAFRPDIDLAADAPGSAPGPAVDLLPLLRLATTRAMNAAEEKLLDAASRAARASHEPVKRKPLEEVARRLTVGVQVGHKLETVRVAKSAPLTEIYTKFAPGFHGLRVVSADGTAAGVLWPANALARNTQPQSQFVQPLTDAGYGLEAPAQVGRAGGPPLQRFEVYHVVRPRLNQPATELVRGNVLLPPQSVTGASLEAMSHRMASHLAKRFLDDGKVRGTYHPSNNQYDPPLAEPEGQAMAAYALAHYSRLVLAGAADDVQALRWREAAQRAAIPVARAAMQDRPPPTLTPAAAAFALLTLVETPTDADTALLRDRLGERLIAMQTEAGRFTATLTGNPPTDELLNEARSALMLTALAALFNQTRDQAVGNAALLGLTALWESTGGRPKTSSLPWLMLAHDYGRAMLTQNLTGDLERQREPLIAQRRELGSMLDLLNEQQVVEPPLLGPNDVVGGFEIVTAPAGSPPNPDISTSHLLLFVAVALRDEHVVGERQVFPWLLTAGLAARFIDQLSMHPSSAYYIRSLDDALGGVRVRLWDNAMPIDATAMSLLAVTELRASVTAMTPQDSQ